MAPIRAGTGSTRCQPARWTWRSSRYTLAGPCLVFPTKKTAAASSHLPAASPPDELIATYERLLGVARNDPVQAKSLLGTGGVLSKALERYVSALAATRGETERSRLCAAYEAILELALAALPDVRDELVGALTAVGIQFYDYVAVLIEQGRTDEVAVLVEKLRPLWKHNLGFASLGEAAFKGGHHALAESLLVELHSSAEHWHRMDEMNALAAIWQADGRADDAHRLLIDALRRLLAESETATGGDRKSCEEYFQSRRSAYLKVFPDRGDAERGG